MLDLFKIYDIIKKMFEEGVIMSLLICPECRNKVSEYAELCPECGCPINIIKKKNQEIVDTLPDKIRCCVCGGVRMKDTYISNDYKCTICGADVRMTLEEINEENNRKSSDQTSNINDNNQSQNPNTPHCPTCNSTNIHKISVTSKALNAGLFGLLGNKRKKQFHCNNCGYEW